MHIFQIDERLFGGEHPGLDVSRVPPEITCFVDLTEFGDAKYASGLAIGRKYFRFPIPDAGVPHSFDEMHGIVSALRRELAAGEMVYLHCHGGCGRTGTVAGCYLADRFGLGGSDAFRRLQECFAVSEKGRLGLPCPETEEQTEFILNYADRSKKQIFQPYIFL